MIAPPAQPRRLAYLGTPALAVPPLEALIAAGFEVAMVVSRPDARRGRRGELSPSPVKQAALDLGLPVTESVDDLLDLDLDLGVVIAFGRLIKPHVLARLPMVNMHFSLLPRWRGAAPVERALLAGDTHTGVCIMAVEEGLDTGGSYATAKSAIKPDDTLESVRGRLVELGSALLVETLTGGLGAAEPQVGEVTYAEKLSPADLELDWNLSAVELDRVVRVGPAWTTVAGKRLKIHRVEVEPETDPALGALEIDPALGALEIDPAPGALDGAVARTGGGALRLVEVQPEGKARQPAEAWLNGARLAPDVRLGS